ncbi:hypothetical protein [Aliivibrio fischeri]|uniref:hypothetical protein n=1 Tax=Aliivibrio fischeri TaxID=668 RepID=UPI00080ECF1F|nr:hypothetical protein [Aliivibrio fischeri]OCH02183.1 hypothetical protein A6E10_17605 [Aliivibrio fischeri]
MARFIDIPGQKPINLELVTSIQFDDDINSIRFFFDGTTENRVNNVKWSPTASDYQTVKNWFYAYNIEHIIP